MKLSFVFLCLSLATLSLASIPSPAKKSSLSPSEKNGSCLRRLACCARRTKKKPVQDGKPVPKNRPRASATKGLKTSASADEKSSVVSGSGKDSQGGSAVLGFFPKALVELIGEYLEGFSVVYTRNWSAAYSWRKVAVDSERHYLITPQDVQASGHGDGKPVSLGSPDLSYYEDFHSSHDGRSLFFAGYTKEQVSSDSLEKTARWLLQDTSTKGFKSVTLDGGIYDAQDRFMLSANGKTLASAHCASDTETASVYQIKKYGKAASASKKANFDGDARAVSGNGNRILLSCWKKEQLEIHDIGRDRSNLVLEINYAGTTNVDPCALNNDGSKAAFIVDKRKLYIVDVDKQKGSVSVKQLTPIDTPNSFLYYSLIYDAKDRLYAFGNGNLWLVDPSKREFISLEEAEVPQGYEIVNSAVSPNGDYIVLLFRSEDANEKGEYQFQMLVKRNEEVTKKAFLRLCGCES